MNQFKIYFLAFVFGSFAVSSSLALASKPLLMPHMSSAAAAPAVAAATGVSYYGGPVISNVKVHLVFWGQGVASDTQTQLAAFYTAITNSTFIDQLVEYNTNITAVDGSAGSNQTIGRGVLVDETTITPSNTSTTLAQADVEKELEYQISTGKLPKADANSLYMLHYPNGYTINISFGASCSTWFADHEVYKSADLGNVYYAMFPCNSGDSTDLTDLTTAASHELAESITDPECPLANIASAFPAAWIDASGNEIGDLCAWQEATLTTTTDSTFSVQELWLNSKNACGTVQFNQ